MIYIGSGLLAIVLISLGLSRLKPAAPTVERATVWIDTVKRGPMIRQVRGLGTLVPEEIRWIPAASEGRVEQILVLPGTEVKADTVLLELSNPELEQTALEAELQLKAAEAGYTDLKVRLRSQLLDQQALVATAEARQKEAQLRAEADRELAKDGLTSMMNLKISEAQSEEMGIRLKIEKERLEISAESFEAQLAVKQAEVDQQRALYLLKREQLRALRVTPGLNGVLQQMEVQVGQRVTPGTMLAKVAQPDKLKAELRIAETQAKDIMLGQPAMIDTRNGVIEGKVTRIDPAVQNGTVTVDAALIGPLPKGARPDLSVDGTIELENLADVVFVGRPAYGQSDSVVGLFKLEAEGDSAVRTPVKLGRSSVNTIEILDGLQPGDRVILSDMSQWDSVDRVRLN
ncbi:MAG TPA: HlyD family efflux transporter periplasmic adaptor subunit [Acidobacteriota bacterium]